ncbi:uncharacterized protein FYN16_014817 [Cariama cristata]
MAKAEKGTVATSNMDGAWVGTWRPHRPHGPIMAQFTSPGPKYSIPGTTGKTTIVRWGHHIPYPQGTSSHSSIPLSSKPPCSQLQQGHRSARGRLRPLVGKPQKRAACYLAHNPTKTKAPAYTFQGAKRPVAESCSPGPRYYVQPSITRNGKYVAPAQHICGRPKIRTEIITAGPSDYATDKANKHIYKCTPAHSMAFRHKAVKTDQSPEEPPASLPPLQHSHTCSSIPLPGPAAYTLPRLVGPNTAYTHASPCYSIRGKSKHNGFAKDLSKVSYAFLLCPVNNRSSAALLSAEGLQCLLQPLLTHTSLHQQRNPRSHGTPGSPAVNCRRGEALPTPALPRFPTQEVLVPQSSLAPRWISVLFWEICLSAGEQEAPLF